MYTRAYDAARINMFVQAHLECFLGHPHCTVALEAAAKAELPHLVRFLDTLVGLNVGQHVPAAAEEYTHAQ